MSVAEVTYSGMSSIDGCISTASAKFMSESEDGPDEVEDSELEELEVIELDEEPDVEEVSGGEGMIFFTPPLLVTTANQLGSVRVCNIFYGRRPKK